MGYTTFEQFSLGVDRKRPIYVGQAGSLWSCINGHLSRGGDVEQRKAFVQTYALPVGTFGLASDGLDALYVFGSIADPGVPAGLTYQRLQHPDGVTEMSALLDWECYAGKMYAIARFADDSIHHYYDGTLVADWENGIVASYMVNNDGIATHLASLITSSAYIVSVVGNVITIRAAVAGTPFTLTAETENVEGGATDQSAVVNETVANVPAVAEVLSSVSFNVTAGTSNPGTNEITSITIAGVEVMDTDVDWATSNNVTAANIATQINAFNSAPEYTATSVGQTVTIRAAAGSGDSPNGFSVVITTAGDMRINGAAGTTVNLNMVGGVDAVAGQAQQATVTIGGTFDPGDRFTVILDDLLYGARGNPRTKGTVCLTHQQKLYVGAGSILYFSKVNDATKWNSEEDTGAGFINMSTNSRGAQDIVALAVYQGKLAVFSRRVVQIWFTDVDDSLNRQEQVLERTGTIARESVLAFNDMDVFYLSDSGVRSLRARDINNTATVNDVGTAIDVLIRDILDEVGAQVASEACAVIEPTDGRFWLTIGERTFAFTYFPSAKISAWSWYELDFQVQFWAERADRVYARSGNVVYLYGGEENDEYDDDIDVVVQMPFFSAQKHGTYKQWKAIDIASAGTWHIQILTNPNDLTQMMQVGDAEGFTYQQDNIALVGHHTHVAPLLTCHANGTKASLSNLSLFYEGAEDE